MDTYWKLLSHRLHPNTNKTVTRYKLIWQRKDLTGGDREVASIEKLMKLMEGRELTRPCLRLRCARTGLSLMASFADMGLDANLLMVPLRWKIRLSLCTWNISQRNVTSSTRTSSAPMVWGASSNMKSVNSPRSRTITMSTLYQGLSQVLLKRRPQDCLFFNRWQLRHLLKTSQPMTTGRRLMKKKTENHGVLPAGVQDQLALKISRYSVIHIFY